MIELAYFVPDGVDGPYFIPAYLKDDGTYTDDTWPASAVLMTEEETSTYWKQTPPVGKLLGVEDDHPAWVNLPAPTPEQLTALADQQKAALRQTADAEIAWRQDAVDAGIATADEAAALAGWKKYRVLLMRVDTSKAPAIEWPTPPDVQAS
ncbi:tail fiber assembly protein [Enterobacter roggenkampii]